MDFLGSQSLTLKTEAAGAHVNGDWVPGVETLTEVEGSVQPLNGREIQRLPEGLHERATAKFYTETELQLAKKERDGTTPDRILWKGKWYELEALEAWEGVGIGLEHFKYLLLAPEVSAG